MTQSDFWSEELPANHSLLQDLGKDLKIQEAILLSPMLEFLTTLDPSGSFGKMCQVSLVAGGARLWQLPRCVGRTRVWVELQGA